MKYISSSISQMTRRYYPVEMQGTIRIRANGNEVTIGLEDVEILSNDIPGWLLQMKAG